MDLPRKLSSLDKNYRHGDLSVFPQALDSKTTLFEASNNAETFVKHHFTFTSKYLIVDDATAFPNSGLLHITRPDGFGEVEKIYYAQKIGNQFHLLQRNFGMTRHGSWPEGCKVTCPVMAEHHNALKDAIIKIQKKIGILQSTDNDSLHGMVRRLEQRWLVPKAVFRAYPKVGPSPLTVRLQNLSHGDELRFLWDFGDGTTSTEKHPVHIFLGEGIYTVKLNIIATSSARSFTEKSNYITVNNQNRASLFYGRPLSGYSAQSAKSPTKFEFVDQTDGEIIERHWFFGDGHDVTVSNPNKHTVIHVYDKPGLYNPTLIVRYADDQMNKTNILEGIMVL